MNFTFTKAGREWNEDRCYSCEDFAFAIDGATGLGDEKISTMNSDAEWYSEWWFKYLKEQLKDYSRPIHEIVYSGVDKVVSEFKTLANGKSIIDFPSSAINIARKLENGNLEIYVLGDSPLLVQTETGHTFEISDTLNNINDGITLATLEYHAKKDNIPFFEARKKYASVVAVARDTKNNVWGYNVLSDKPEAVKHGIYKILDGKVFKKVLLMTDGYSQVYDTFNLYSLDEFATKLDSIESAEKIYNELYEAQEHDSDASAHIRFKIRDDATLSVLDINK